METVASSPYLTGGRLQDIIAAIQVMGASPFVISFIDNWTDRFGSKPSSADAWETIFRQHPELFSLFIPGISPSHVKSPTQLAEQLSDIEYPPSHHLQASFTVEAKKKIVASLQGQLPSENVVGTIIDSLMYVAHSQELDKVDAFADKIQEIPEATRQLIEKLPTRHATILRNRALIERAYPDTLAPGFLHISAALTLRYAFTKNYDALTGTELPASEVQSLKSTDYALWEKLSRRPLTTNEIQGLITIALELHKHYLAQNEEERAESAEERAKSAEQRANKQYILSTRQFGLSIATAVIAFLAMVSSLYGVLEAARIKADLPPQPTSNKATAAPDPPPPFFKRPSSK